MYFLCLAKSCSSNITTANRGSNNNACQLFCVAWGMHVALRETGSQRGQRGTQGTFSAVSQSGLPLLLPQLLALAGVSPVPLLMMKCRQQNSIFSQCHIAFDYEPQPGQVRPKDSTLLLLFWLVIPTG